jgi:hypothetical protein
MALPKPDTSRVTRTLRTAAFVLIAFEFLIPAALRAGRPASDETRSRFRLDLYGGYAFLGPADLNRFVENERTVQEFAYEAYLDHLRASALIQSWAKAASGEWRTIKGGFPFGLRVRYAALDFLDISIGFQYLNREAAADMSSVYTRNELSGPQYLESLDRRPLSVKVRAYWPSVGIHVRRRIGLRLSAEGFVAGGPLFAECLATSQSTYLWTIQGPGYAWETYTTERLLEERGSGTGIGLEIGARIGWPLFRGGDVFLEGGYATQAIRSISGSGSETRDGDTESWEGKWSMRSETMETPWGTRRLAFPSSSPAGVARGNVAGDFKLDLSGARLKFGLSMGF